jgi:hypothetical protein
MYNLDIVVDDENMVCDLKSLELNCYHTLNTRVDVVTSVPLSSDSKSRTLS